MLHKQFTTESRRLVLSSHLIWRRCEKASGGAERLEKQQEGGVCKMDRMCRFFCLPPRVWIAHVFFFFFDEQTGGRTLAGSGQGVKRLSQADVHAVNTLSVHWRRRKPREERFSFFFQDTSVEVQLKIPRQNKTPAAKNNQKFWRGSGWKQRLKNTPNLHFFFYNQESKHFKNKQKKTLCVSIFTDLSRSDAATGT